MCFVVSFNLLYLVVSPSERLVLTSRKRSSAKYAITRHLSQNGGDNPEVQFFSWPPSQANSSRACGASSSTSNPPWEAQNFPYVPFSNTLEGAHSAPAVAAVPAPEPLGTVEKTPQGTSLESQACALWISHGILVEGIETLREVVMDTLAKLFAEDFYVLPSDVNSMLESLRQPASFIVAGGNHHTYGQDHMETYAPVMSFNLVQVFL